MSAASFSTAGGVGSDGGGASSAVDGTSDPFMCHTTRSVSKVSLSSACSRPSVYACDGGPGGYGDGSGDDGSGAASVPLAVQYDHKDVVPSKDDLKRALQMTEAVLRPYDAQFPRAMVELLKDDAVASPNVVRVTDEGQVVGTIYLWRPVVVVPPAGTEAATTATTKTINTVTVTAAATAVTAATTVAAATGGPAMGATKDSQSADAGSSQWTQLVYAHFVTPFTTFGDLSAAVQKEAEWLHKQRLLSALSVLNTAVDAAVDAIDAVDADARNVAMQQVKHALPYLSVTDTECMALRARVVQLLSSSSSHSK